MNYPEKNVLYLALSLAITVPVVSYCSKPRLVQQHLRQHCVLHAQTIEDKLSEPLSESTPVSSSPNEIYIPPFVDDFSHDNDEVLLARLLYGEARDASREVKYAIANVVLNRSERPCWWGRNLHEVILAPRQFSCFNSNDPNRRKLADPLHYERAEVWQECYEVARDVLVNRQNRTDPTNGATHYYDSSITTPRWARNLQPILELPAGNGRSVRFYNAVL